MKGKERQDKTRMVTQGKEKLTGVAHNSGREKIVYKTKEN